MLPKTSQYVKTNAIFYKIGNVVRIGLVEGDYFRRLCPHAVVQPAGLAGDIVDIHLGFSTELPERDCGPRVLAGRHEQVQFVNKQELGPLRLFGVRQDEIAKKGEPSRMVRRSVTLVLPVVWHVETQPPPAEASTMLCASRTGSISKREEKSSS